MEIDKVSSNTILMSAKSVHARQIGVNNAMVEPEKVVGAVVGPVVGPGVGTVVGTIARQPGPPSQG
jgi:hypothetical protein